MTQGQLQRLRKLISDGKEREFYFWEAWRRKRPEVLAMDKYECQRCKARGRYSRAVIVHHIKHLRDRPDLALSIFDPDTGERQLLSVCKKCHEDEHPEAFSMNKPKQGPQITAERWD